MSDRLRAALPWLLLATAIAFPWAAQAADQHFYIGFVRRILIFALAAASLNLILGFGGMVSLGHAAFFGIGAYTVAVLMSEGVTSVWIAWPAAVALAALASVIIGAVSLRTRGVYFIMITLAFAQMVYYVAIGLKKYGGEDGLNLPGRSELALGALRLDLGNDIVFYYVALALFAAAMLAINRMIGARFGRALIGIRENEARMEGIGFATFRIRLIAFVIAGSLAGLAGALFANHNLFVSPATLHWTQSATLVIMVILGGIGYRYGGLAGAAALLAFEEVLALYTDYRHFALGIVLLIVVFAAPSGLAGLLPRRFH
ncbi:branched-chain amino acid ABC transporter permease [Betaproteobacteria bacterium PRO7]|jgi:branched-chain amino acid transport system permease protein|nr:branched-chain amino acid ABC transporter permease [Burkholderiaceae bacterium]MDL1861667.1 branched-chain amino acid ABC transporter permease [Betaproteobacteria bacterium PRO7]GIL04550.1 MAG: branched-chain amino acid ABC transporter permease [Betaproteobacteria bacterium]